MLISDWSSDVCSSDLCPISGAAMTRTPYLIPAAVATSLSLAACAATQDSGGPSLAPRSVEARFDVAQPAVAVEPPGPQIGRASCRERGSQYMEISVVATYLKKKTKFKTYLSRS